MSSDKPKSSFNYSEAIAELEEITSYLESAEVDLDEAIKKFDRGSELANQIEKYLKTAENKIRSIKEKSVDK
jgi:exodeoxyribonuclease VII small subunit